MRTIKKLIFIMIPLFLNSCIANLNSQAESTTKEILLTIKDGDEKKFGNYFEEGYDMYEFKILCDFYNDSILTNHHSQRNFKLKDTIIILGGVLGKLKYKYIDIPYYKPPKGLGKAYKELKLYIYFDERYQANFNKAYFYELNREK